MAMDIGQLLGFLRQPAMQAQAINPASLLPQGAGQPPAALANIYAQEQAAKRDAAATKAAQEAAAAKALQDRQTLIERQGAAAGGIAEFLAPLQEQMPEETWNLFEANQQMLTNPETFDLGMSGIEKLLQDRSDYRTATQKDSEKMSTSMRLGMELYPDDPVARRKFVEEHAMKSGVTIDQGQKYLSVSDLGKLMMPDGSPVPPGTTWDQANKMGVILRDAVSGETAGKLGMLQTSQELFGVIDDLMFDEEGNPNTENIRNAFLIGLDPTPGEGIAKIGLELFGGAEKADEAGRLYQAFETGFQALTRTETGAAMPPEEVENTKRRFRPGPLDSDAEVMQKYNAYKSFVNNAIRLMRPTEGKGKTYGDDTAALSADLNRLADQALISAGYTGGSKEDGPGTGVTVPENMGENFMDYLTEELPPGATPILE